MKNIIDLEFYQTKDIKQFKNIFNGLTDEFGMDYYHSILVWCGILDRTDSKYWQTWLVKSREDDTIIAYCGLYSLTESTDELWLGWLGIIPSYRNKGIGNNILDYLISVAKELNCVKILSYVDKNEKPLKFYQRYGFNKITTVGEYVKMKNISMDHFSNPYDIIIEKFI